MNWSGRFPSATLGSCLWQMELLVMRNVPAVFVIEAAINCKSILTSVLKANEIVAEEIEGDSVCRPTSTLTDKDSCPVVVGLNWTGLDQPQHSWPHHLSRSSYSLRLIVVPATCRFSPSLVSLSSSCILQGVDGGMFIKLLHVWLAIVSSLP